MYCINCFCSYRTENKLNKHKKVNENHDSCYIETPEVNNKILKYSHGEKPMKAPFTIYADLKSLLEKMNTCHNNHGKSSTTKINKHTPSGYSLFTHCSFDATENGHSTKIMNYKKKEMIHLTKKEEKMQNKQKVCHICKKRFSTDDSKKVLLSKKTLSLY